MMDLELQKLLLFSSNLDRSYDQYQEEKVTAKTKAKHEVSDYLMELFNNPQRYIKDLGDLTTKEQDEVLRHISLFEDRIHKVLGVSFKQIDSKTNFIKNIGE